MLVAGEVGHNMQIVGSSVEKVGSGIEDVDSHTNCCLRCKNQDGISQMYHWHTESAKALAKFCFCYKIKTGIQPKMKRNPERITGVCGKCYFKFIM